MVSASCRSPVCTPRDTNCDVAVRATPRMASETRTSSSEKPAGAFSGRRFRDGSFPWLDRCAVDTTLPGPRTASGFRCWRSRWDEIE